MDMRILTMSSQTAAIKAQRALQKNGIPCKVVRPSPKKTPRGCTWGIETDVFSVNSAVYTLNTAQIPYGEIIRI